MKYRNNIEFLYFMLANSDHCYNKAAVTLQTVFKVSLLSKDI